MGESVLIGEAAEQRGVQQVLVCSVQLRSALRRLARSITPNLPVLSYSELGPQLRLENIGVVSLVDPVAV